MHRLICAVICALPTAAFAVGTSHWVHNSEADFKQGKFENVVATNLGDLKLSRAVKTLLEQEAKVSSVYALAEAPDGTIYAGTGPQGVLLAIKDGKVSTAATLKDGENIFALLVDKQGRVVLGTGGDKGRILRIDHPGAAPTEVFADEKVQYVWALQQSSDGNLYAATGPNGLLFEIQPNGTRAVLLDSDEHNLLSMISDGQDKLYVGTDPHGLVYRVDRKTHEAFVLYDAAESEISALALDSAGNLYAGTAEADIGPEVESEAGGVERAGRPENAPGGHPIPSVPPAEPQPPELPPPNPGEPAPIPKKPVSAEPMHLSAYGDDGSDDDKGAAAPKPGEPGPPSPVDPHAPRKGRRGEGSKAPPPRIPHKMTEPGLKGNAIYRIDSEGFVTEIFRQSVLVLSLLERNGVLLVGTGSDGVVYQVDPAAEETVALANVDPKQVMCLLAARDGRVYMGMANTGALGAMSPGFAPEGTYTSAVLDASQISRFGKMQLKGSLPDGTGLKVCTRSGNVDSPQDKGWSSWSQPAPAAQFVDISSPAARFLQYRLIFSSTDDKHTPVVDEVDVAYQVPNLAPQVKSIRMMRGARSGEAALELPALAPAPKATRAFRTISWDAADPNNDPIVYTLYYRQGAHGKWILLKDKLKETTFDWDTRTVGDGQYYVKVVASDEAANPRGSGKVGSRVSDPLFIDNTPPVIGDLIWKKQKGGAQINLRVIDRAGTVAAVDYSVDSNDDWQAVLPSDSIFDQPEETVSFAVSGLAAGAHQVTVRATDAYGNQAFESLVVTVEPSARKD